MLPFVVSGKTQGPGCEFKHRFTRSTLWICLAVTFFASFSFRQLPAQELGNSASTVVIVVSHLDWPALEATDLPNLALIRNDGAVALVSPGLPHLPNADENQWATFTAGDVVNTKNPHIGLLQRQLMANGASGQMEIIRFGDVSTLSRLSALNRLVGLALPSPTNNVTKLMVCGIVPPKAKDGWDELTPLILYPAAPGTVKSLTSATTRTPGLVALRDIAPTLLAFARVPIPLSMTGAPINQVILRGQRDSILSRMALITQLGQEVIVPLSWFLGLAALFAVGGGAWVAASGKAANGPLICYLLRLVIAAPLALLICPQLPVSSVTTYLIVLIVADCALALINSPMLLVVTTSISILLDGLTGSHLIAETVISGYWLSGIRFYGIGNEYMGVLIGMSLLAPVMLLEDRWPRLVYGVRSLITGFYYLVVIFVLSYPAFGAKAGGAVTSVVTFGLAWVAMYLGVKPKWLGFFVASLAGFVLIFALNALSIKLHAPPSHISAAITAVHQGRLGYIKHIAIRKAKMAVKTVLTPGGIVAIIGLIPLWIFWQRSLFKSRVEDFLLMKPELGAALGAGAWGLLAALLFNDSGGVAFLFFFGAMALVLLHEMVWSECVSSRLMSAMSV